MYELEAAWLHKIRKIHLFRVVKFINGKTV